MINALFALGFVAHVLQCILFDSTWFRIYGVLFVAYLSFVLYTRNMKENPKRKTLMIATWNGKQILLLKHYLFRAFRSDLFLH